MKELILQRCREVEKKAIDQATDNAILDRLGKVSSGLQTLLLIKHFWYIFGQVCTIIGND